MLQLYDYTFFLDLVLGFGASNKKLRTKRQEALILGKGKTRFCRLRRKVLFGDPIAFCVVLDFWEKLFKVLSIVLILYFLLFCHVM